MGQENNKSITLCGYSKLCNLCGKVSSATAKEGREWLLDSQVTKALKWSSLDGVLTSCLGCCRQTRPQACHHRSLQPHGRLPTLPSGPQDALLVCPGFCYLVNSSVFLRHTVYSLLNFIHLLSALKLFLCLTTIATRISHPHPTHLGLSTLQ